MAKAVAAKWLTGLKVRDIMPNKIQKDGRDVISNIAIEREAKIEDVLDWADKGDTIVIVFLDGSKQTVEKSPKEKTDGKADA